MSRAAEKTLAIISIVFTGISIPLYFMFSSVINSFNSDVALRQEFEVGLISDGLSGEEIEMILLMLDTIEPISTLIIVLLFISLLTTIIGTIFIWNNKKPKLAGAMFIVGGLFALLLTPTSIMLYIAGLLCFTRKGPPQIENPYLEDGDGESMRPL